MFRYLYFCLTKYKVINIVDIIISINFIFNFFQYLTKIKDIEFGNEIELMAWDWEAI